jgi:hypothetical protein
MLLHPIYKLMDHNNILYYGTKGLGFLDCAEKDSKNQLQSYRSAVTL